MRWLGERLKFPFIISTRFKIKDERIARGFCLDRRICTTVQLEIPHTSYASAIRALCNNCYNAADNNNNDDGSCF